jgi:hypothetical protein
MVGSSITSLPLRDPPQIPNPEAPPSDKAARAKRIGELTRDQILDLEPALPYIDKSHLEDEDIQISTMDWIKRFRIIPEGELLKKISASRFGIFIGKCHPQGVIEKVIAVAQYATWLFIYDDMIEKKTEEEIETFHARTLQVLKGDKVTEKDHRLMKGLHEIAECIDRIAPSKIWKERFYNENASYCRYSKKEAENRRQKRVPTLAEYLIERPEFSGTKIMFALIELVENITIPEETFNSPLMQKILLLAANAVNWENDFLSAQKEYLNDDVHNLIFVLQKEYNCSIEEAFARGRTLFDENQKQLLECIKEASALGEDVQRYVAGIMDWLSGHHYWAKASPRYSYYFTSPRLMRRGDVNG